MCKYIRQICVKRPSALQASKNERSQELNDLAYTI